jgi:hypothetical protein
MKKLILPVTLMVALFLIAVGCSTGGSVVKLGEAPGGYTTLTHEGITLRLSYINDKDLLKLYGQKNNPFIKTSWGTLIVIEAAIQSDAALRLVLRDAQLSTPGGSRGPTSKEAVSGYWYTRLSKNYSSSPSSSAGRSTFSNWSLKVTGQIIDESVFPVEFSVQSGTETVGYILFDQVRGEKKVDATMTLPVYDQKGKLQHEFEFNFPI